MEYMLKCLQKRIADVSIFAKGRGLFDENATGFYKGEK